MPEDIRIANSKFNQAAAELVLKDRAQLMELTRKFLRGQNWAGVGWLACSEEGCDAIEAISNEMMKKGRPSVSVGYQQNSGAVLDIFMANPSNPDIAQWFGEVRLEKIMKHASTHNYPGLDWMRRLRLQDNTILEKELSLVNRLLDKSLISGTCVGLNKRQVDGVITQIVGSVLCSRAWLNTRDAVDRFDNLVSQHPRIVKGVEKYWGTDAWKNGIHSFGRYSHDLIRVRLGTTIPPRRDALDMSMALGRDWVIEEVLGETEVGREVICRIGEKDELHWFLCDLSPSQALSIVPTLVKHLGAEWRDTGGRNLAHALSFDTNPIRRGAIISLAAKPEMAHLFTTPDLKGETPLEWMSKLPGWDKHPDLISKIKRRVMKSFVSERPVQRRAGRLPII